MISKNELKYYSSLNQKKFRNEENKFIIEGKRIVEEALNSKAEVEAVFITRAYEDSNIIPEIIFKKNLRFEILKNSDFQKLTDTVNPQGIAAVVKKSPKIFHADKIKDEIVVSLDNINDPGNIGTIIRICDWFGIKTILAGKGCAEIFNPKTLRSTMGSVFHLDVYENIDLLSELKKLKNAGYKLGITDLQGENLFQYNFPDKIVITFSSEAHGPSPEILKIADLKITIPKFGKAESLNVASAAAVIISQIKKG